GPGIAGSTCHVGAGTLFGSRDVHTCPKVTRLAAATFRRGESPCHNALRIAVRTGGTPRLPQADPTRRARRASRAPAARGGTVERCSGLPAVAPAARGLRPHGKPIGQPSARG